LHDGREDADHDCGGNDCEAIAAEHLPKQDSERGSITAVSMKPYQSSLRLTPPALKRPKTSRVGLRRIFG
jgi:hypothetical protein